MDLLLWTFLGVLKEKEPPSHQRIARKEEAKMKYYWPIGLMLLLGLVLVTSVIIPLAYLGAVLVLTAVFWGFIERAILAVWNQIRNS